MEGHCTCCKVRYRLESAPIIVHCCHCTWCQRESGAAFALNAVIEASRVTLLSGEVEIVNTPSLSGKGQKISRCAVCRVAVWSNYPGGGDKIRFVRVGTLQNPELCPPDVHIFTSTKQPWVTLPKSGAVAVAEFYNPAEVWKAESRERYKAAMG